MHLVYNLRSKTRVAEKIIRKLPKDQRTLIFCGSIAQAEELMGDMVYHSKSGNEAFRAFKNQEINQLAVVRALDEGENIPNLHNGIIVQTSSVGRQAVQRIGRLLRVRPGHRAKIFALSTFDTVDTKWMESSLSTFDASKISHYSSLNLL